METNKIILQGGGQHAKVVLDCLLAQRANVFGLFDAKEKGEILGIPQRGVYDPKVEPSAHAIVAIGDNAIRKRVVAETKHKFTNAVHPTAIISPHASLGVGDMILHGVIVQAVSTIGNHVILNTAARVDHDCLIGDFVHLGPGVILCGTVSVGEGAFIGAGAVVVPGKRIGAWAIVGAGSVVLKDIPDYAVAVGNPARIIKVKPA